MKTKTLFALLAAIPLALTVADATAATVYNQSTFTQGMTTLSSPTQIWPPPQAYTCTAITKGMTPLTSGTTLFDSIYGSYDDSATTFTLPFSFTYFGTAYTTAGVSTNGLFTFGTSDTTYSNTTIPNTSTPNAFVTPFWDDMYVFSSMGAKIWWTTQGTSPNRVVVVEWYRLNHISSSTSYHTAQVKLYEGTYNIEICYDNNNQNWYTGMTSTIGIEDNTGSSGLDATGNGANNNTCPGSNYRFAIASSNYDDASQSVAIPFAFAFYGNYFNTVNVSTNGFITFGSAGATDATNDSIPSTTTPNEYIALFWDDLLVGTNGVSDRIRYGTIGSSPNRIFVVEYYYVTRSGQTGSEMTGQIHLLETSNRIELHYATGAANTWTGVSATIGLEDASGTVGTGGPNTGNTNSSCPTVNYRFDPVQTCTLTVASTYGSPNPAVGTHTYNGNTSVTCSVSSPVSGGTGIQYVCTGWTGTGDVPATGSGATVTFTINQNSTITWNWQTQYQLSLTASPTGGGTLSSTPSGSWIPAGVSVQIQASANAGYIFNNWTGTQTSTANPHTFTMNGPETITGNFWAMQFTLSILGSPSQYGSPTPAYGATNYGYGTSITCSISSPIAGPTGTRYVCTGWTGTGSVPASGTGLTTTFTLTQNSSITWNWQVEYQLSVSESPSGTGTVTCTPPGPWIPSGTSVTIWGTASSGFMFQNWTGLINSSNNPETFTLTGTGSITGNFTVLQLTLDVTSTQGSPTPSGQTQYTYNTPVTCSVSSPVDGGSGIRHVCLGWSGTGDVPATGATTSTSFNITQNSTITWLWRTEYQVTAAENPAGSGSVTLNPPGPWYLLNDVITCTAVPTAQYHFVNWGTGITGTSNPETLTVAGSTAVTANFQPNGPSLTVASAQGAPSPPVGSQTYFAGSAMTLSVSSPYSGSLGTRYYCTGWTGTGDVPASGTDSTVDITLNNDSTITWLWRAEYELTGSVTPNGSGTVAWDPAGPWFPEGTSVTITATPSSGHTFLSWTGGIASTDNPAVVVMNGPRNVVANFMTPRVLGVAVGPANPASTLESATASGLQVLQARFTAGAGEAIRIDSVTLRVIGSSDESLTVAQTRCYLDVNANGAYDPAYDLPVDGGKTFSGDNGSATFTAMPPINLPAGQTKYLLFVFDLNAAAGDTFTARITNDTDVAAVVVSSSSPAQIVGLPVEGGQKTAAPAGTPGSLEVYRGPNSPKAMLVKPGAAGAPMLQLILKAGSLEGVSVSSLKISTMGSGDDSSAITGIRLYRDTNGDGNYDTGEALLGSAAGFASDNGSVTFTGMAGLIPAGAQETWLVVADFAGSASGEFRFGVADDSDVSAAGAVSFTSLVVAGPPFWNATITAGVEPAILPVFFIGGCGAGSGGMVLLPLALLIALLALLSLSTRRIEAR